ncbi:hypothetical protein BD779DRAFT_1544162 [Infundibulicybe gibba]|nr:hypothetical protein BD779DRAFT_1544162 [Infundibulicybe gibba]
MSTVLGEQPDTSTRVWLITGTSSGFGRRLVISVLARGDRVIATARSRQKQQDLLQRIDEKERSNLRFLELDLTEGGDSIKAKIDVAAGMWGRIDVLVNNAGIGYPGLIEEGGTALLRKQFETNVFGVMDVTYATLPHMRAQRRGMVVMTGSRSAWKTEVPAAIHALAETLRVELAQFNIRMVIGIYGQPYFTSNPIVDYDDMRTISARRFASVAGTEKGDPVKAMEVVADVVRGEGVAQGKSWPEYLVLGADAENDVRVKCDKVLAILNEWVDVTRDVNLS